MKCNHDARTRFSPSCSRSDHPGMPAEPHAILDDDRTVRRRTGVLSWRRRACRAPAGRTRGPSRVFPLSIVAGSDAEQWSAKVFHPFLDDFRRHWHRVGETAHPVLDGDAANRSVPSRIRAHSAAVARADAGRHDIARRSARRCSNRIATKSTSVSQTMLLHGRLTVSAASYEQAHRGIRQEHVAIRRPSRNRVRPSPVVSCWRLSLGRSRPTGQLRRDRMPPGSITIVRPPPRRFPSAIAPDAALETPQRLRSAGYRMHRADPGNDGRRHRRAQALPSNPPPASTYRV